MRSMRLPRIWLAIALLAGFLVVMRAGNPVEHAQALTNCTVSNLTIDSEEAQFLSLINQYRTANGLGTLTMSVNLNRAASWMAIDLSNRPPEQFGHTDSLGRSPQQRGEDCDSIGGIGENIAAGTVWDTAQEAFDAWKASSGHNANMLYASYKQIGIARYNDTGSYYKWYWVTDFSTVDDGTRATEPLPACGAPTISSHSDTNQSGGGTVSFQWQAVSGATQYKIFRYNGSAWTYITTVSSTSYSGADAADDPVWRVYASAGSGCTPPGPSTVLDPGNVPQTCAAPIVTSHSDTNSSGAGTVTFAWQAVSGATQYKIFRYNGAGWTFIATVSGTSYSGEDGSGDPVWRLYASAGSGCTVPGLNSLIDP